MSSFRHIPLGTRIPNRLHAVSCSLPTMRDVVGYEEKDEETVAHMCSGYPRFVVHPLLLDIESAWRELYGLEGKALWIVSSERMARQLATHMEGIETRIVDHDGVFGLIHPDELELRKDARSFLQHTGGFLSSRAAEDYATRNKLIEHVQAEDIFEGDATARVRDVLADYLAPASPDSIHLAPSGMNTFWAAFNAVSDLQRAQGRDTWLQIGWLYLDTGAILAKFTHEKLVCVYNVNDREAIERAFEEFGSRLAGVVTEVTTNPLMQTVDLPWLSTLARDHGAFMLVDPSITSPYNVDVMPYADVVLNSLTKYAGCEGDVILGAAAVSPDCPRSAEVNAALHENLEPVYSRDLARLALEINGYQTLIEKLNTGAQRVIDHLRNRNSGVRRLFWSLQDGSRDNYRQLMRAPDRIGPVFSFEIDGSMEKFYDALRLPKGPSFGMCNTLICPFIYLAHYDLVTGKEGRKHLESAGVSPDLLRISIGAEPPEEIIEALEEGFAAAGV